MMAELPAGVGVIVVQIPSRDKSDQGSFAQPFSPNTLQAPVSKRTVKPENNTHTVFRLTFMVLLLSYFRD
jgi:hypothetical protein